jgi:hypothetical protein
MIDVVYEAIAAGDFALAEERINNITDHHQIHLMSTEFAVGGQYTWANELRIRAEELKQGFVPEPFQFFPEGGISVS